MADGLLHLDLRVGPANDVAGGKGVAVAGVDPDGPAAEQGFKAGDVITDIGGKTIGFLASRIRESRYFDFAG